MIDWAGFLFNSANAEIKPKLKWAGFLICANPKSFTLILRFKGGGIKTDEFLILWHLVNSIKYNYLMKRKFSLSPLAIVFGIVFFDLLGFGILIPVIPQLLANPHSADFLLPASYSLKTGYILLGFLIGLYSFGQFLANPVLGELSDKYGRKPVLAFCLLGTAISYIVFAVAIVTKNLPLLFISRFADGITGGNISVAQAVIADITKPEDRSKNFGLIGAAFGLGFIIGPYLGGKLADPSVVSWFNAATPFWFAAILGFLNLLAVYFYLPETLKNAKKSVSLHWAKSFHNIARALRSTNLRTIFTTSFLFQGGFTFFTTFAAVFFITRFGFTQGRIGDYFSWIGIWIAISQAVVTRRLAGKFREDQIVKVALPLLALTVLSYYFIHSVWILFAVAPFFAVVNGLCQANITALVSRSALPEQQGEILGISSSVQALAQTIPAAISGFIAGSIGETTPLLVAAFTIGMGAIFFVMFFKYKPGKAQPTMSASH
jgi:DHA1 family tetracycline resistance protein-like MFS transporter